MKCNVGGSRDRCCAAAEPLSLLVDSNCIYGAPPLFENSIKILCKEGGRGGRVGWLAEVARPLDRQFLAFGRTTKSEVGGGK